VTEAKKKLAIIDGKSVFYRGYYAMPNLSTKEGVPTGGVFGFAAMSLELIKKLKPDYVAVAWDKPKTNIRKRLELYPQYKAGRKPPPPDFYTQIPILHELLEAFGWPLYELDDYEADDIMGALAVQATEKGIETQLITSDLDALQLVNYHVKVYALKRGFSQIEEYHPESFEARYGIEAEQFLDLKSLKGDSSDNIPGVPGIGEKTAIELLKEHKTLDSVYEHLDDIKESVRKKLEAGKDSAYLSKQLARLWTDAPIKLDLHATDVTKLDTDHLAKLLQKLEFKSLLRSLPEHMQVVAPTTETLGGVKLKLLPNTLIETNADLAKVKIEPKGTLFIHSRAAGQHGADPQVLIIGSDKAIYTLSLPTLDKKVVKEVLEPAMKDAGWVGYDIKNDIKVLKNLDLNLTNVQHDVLMASFLINALLRAQTLTDLAVSQLQYEGAPFEDLPTEDFIARAPEFIALIEELYDVQTHALNEVPKIAKLAEDIEWPLNPVLADMECVGIKLDTDYLLQFNDELAGTISDLEQQIYGHADYEFNIGSPSQLADVLFVKLNLPRQGIKKGKTGYSTAASELDKLRGIHPIIDLITHYREVTKLKNTYVDTLPKQVDERSRVHTTFNLTIAPTGRLSSADPNLQNIPVRTDLGKRIRTAFIAEEGNVLVSADYSQFELRIAAALSGDQGMIDSFNSDSDIHIETAALVYGIKPEEVTKAQRYAAKAVNFGIMYGQGPHGLSATSGLDYGQAREFISKYFEIRPKLKEYIDNLRKQALEDGYVETLLGRRRPTPDVRSSNFMVREGAYRAAINMPVQGTAADLMKKAMIDVNKKLPANAKMLLQIHDSLIIEVPRKEAEAIGKMMKETMENVYKLSVRIKADISTGKNWGKL
jgi:DNA polymerase-1